MKAFTVEAKVDGEWQTIASETTIGYKRILRTKRVTASELRITITDSKASIVISNIQAFNAPTFVRMPAIQRDKSGMVSMDTEAGNTIYYTLDGTTPSAKSLKYNGSFKYDKAVEIKAISIDNEEKISSAIRIVKYGVSKENWKIVSVTSSDLKTANRIIDGNPSTTWNFEEDVNQHPQEVIVDLGSEITIKGFSYIPQQIGNPLNLISNYEFYTSLDGKNWTKQSEGEFSNIKNNPIEQIKTFDPVKTKYLRFVAKLGVDRGKITTIGELSIVE